MNATYHTTRKAIANRAARNATSDAEEAIQAIISARTDEYADADTTAIAWAIGDAAYWACKSAAADIRADRNAADAACAAAAKLIECAKADGHTITR